MRIVLNQQDNNKLFNALNKQHITLRKLAEACEVSVKTISNWKGLKSTLPEDAFKLLLQLSKLNITDFTPEVRTIWWYTSTAGKIGAASRSNRHGKFIGTLASRQHGGQQSYKARREDPQDIFTRKMIHKPLPSEKLAEFFGIMIGDGSISDYQISIALNSVDDREYIRHVQLLITDLFGIKASIQDRAPIKCVILVVSSVELVEFLLQLGLPKGHKIKQKHDMPVWISSDRSYVTACLRGIFDTDGCIYSERHTINSKTYAYPRMSFISASENLRNSVQESLCNLGLEARLRNERSVNLERLTDITTYFTVVGTSNPKHWNRWLQFGGVA